MASEQTINNMISEPRCPQIEASALHNEFNSEVPESLLQYPYLPGNNCHLLKPSYADLKHTSFLVCDLT